MAIVRVSGVQMYVSSKLDENLDKILNHIETSDADFLLFPEMSLTGYHGEFSDKAAKAAWRQIAEACRQCYVTALIGTGVHTDEGTFIQTRIKTDEGALLGTHEKLVPTKGDRQFCRPGEELRLFRHHNITFGCLICNDLWVTPGCGPYPDPRLAYQLGKRGAQIIFHSANSGTDQRFKSYHESNLALRALESGINIVTVNAAYQDGSNNSRSGIVAPDGTWAIDCPSEGAHTFAYDVVIDTG